MPSPPEITLVLSTFEREEDATDTIRTLLGEKLIACGTLLRGARSIYVWEDQLHDTQEILVLFKTAAGPAAAARLAEIHPYDCPEIITLSATASKPYENWIQAVTDQSEIENRKSKIQ